MKFNKAFLTPPPRRLLRSHRGYALLAVMALAGVVSLSAIKGIKQSAARRAAIQTLKRKFETGAFLRRISKNLFNYHACLHTLGGLGASISDGQSISDIKNHAGAAKLVVGNRYGRGMVQFESAVLNNLSGSSVDLEVEVSRWNKLKNQAERKVKKVFPMTIVGSAGSLEGCYLSTGNAVAESNEKLCLGIQHASWTGGRCVLDPVTNKQCPAQNALRGVSSSGTLDCCSTKWVPDHRRWCSGETVGQRTGCNGNITRTGTRSPSWSPSRGSVCAGQSFTQTEQCCRGFGPNCVRGTRTATGTKSCPSQGGNSAGGGRACRGSNLFVPASNFPSAHCRRSSDPTDCATVCGSYSKHHRGPGNTYYATWRPKCSKPSSSVCQWAKRRSRGLNQCFQNLKNSGYYTYHSNGGLQKLQKPSQCP